MRCYFYLSFPIKRKTLKNNEHTKHVPILILSSFPFTFEMIKQMKDLYVDSFLMKPYAFNELIECVKELLKQKTSVLTGIQTPS